MSVAEYCNRDVVVVSKEEPVSTVITLMRSQHVGDVVVVDRQQEHVLPVGILTDRDIVLEIMAEELELDSVSAGDVMSYELITVPASLSLMDTIKYMCDKGVRRMPVVDEQGNLLGIITADDVLELIAEQMQDLTNLIVREKKREIRQRSVR